MRYWLYVAGLASVCVLSSFLTLIGIRHFEGALFPVITDFRITDVRVTPTAVVVSGAFTKRRPCQLVATSVEYEAPTGQKTILARILPENNASPGVGSAEGIYLWGPFVFPRDQQLESALKAGGQIRVVGEHRCHSLWHQYTEYGVVDARVIGSKL